MADSIIAIWAEKTELQDLKYDQTKDLENRLKTALENSFIPELSHNYYKTGRLEPERNFSRDKIRIYRLF